MIYFFSLTVYIPPELSDYLKGELSSQKTEAFDKVAAIFELITIGFF